MSLQAWNDAQNLPQIFDANDKWADIRADRIGDEFGVQYIIKGGGNEYQRIGDIAAVLFAPRESSAGGRSNDRSPVAVPARSRLRAATSYLLTAAVVCAITSAVWWMLRPSVEPRPIARFSISLADDQRLLSINAAVLAMSADGRKIAYAANDGLHVRSISDTDASTLVARAISPAFSPDGQWLAYFDFDTRTLRKMLYSATRKRAKCVRETSFSLVTYLRAPS